MRTRGTGKSSAAENHYKNKRHDQRHNTLVLCKFETLMSGEQRDGVMLNLSKGGACVEMKKSDLAPNEILEITVLLQDPQKLHKLHAEVIWRVSKGDVSSVGIKFVTPKDLYNSLLNSL